MTRFALFKLSRLLLVAASCWISVGAVAQATLQGVQPYRIAEAALGQLPGAVSVGLLRDGRVEVVVLRRVSAGQPVKALDHAAQLGMEPLFEIGSVSKVFTGLLVAQRVERGELKLDDTIGQLLNAKVKFRYEAASTIQVRHLLTHTACLKRWPAAFSAARMFEQSSNFGPAQLWSLMGNHVLGRTPPCETQYSNVGFAVLGETMAMRSQQSWESIFLEDIARPLALRDTRQHLSTEQRARIAAPWDGALRSQTWPAGAFAPAAGLHSTATDLLEFSRALLQGRGGPLGAAAERLVTDLAAFGDQGTRIGYGVLLLQEPVRTWVHNGETRAYKSEWVVWPDSKSALVILASNRAAPTEKIRREIVAATRQGANENIVFTRGEFRGTFTEDEGRSFYARVKVVPQMKIPFSTLNFRIRDSKIVAAFSVGMPAEFRAERVNGENILVEMRRPE